MTRSTAQSGAQEPIYDDRPRDTQSGGQGGSRGDYGRSGPPRKQLEQLRVSSGMVLIVDQFMLANQQFLRCLPADVSLFEEEETRIREAAHMFGGCILSLTPGRWGVFRDPRQTFMLVAPVGEGDLSQYELDFDVDAVADARGNAVAIDHVYIDTRCVVFLDAELLADKDLMTSYRELRKNGDEKGARDLIRERGAAVRYGFNRDGDDLGVYRLGGTGQIALWPNEKPISDHSATSDRDPHSSDPE